MLWVYTAHPPHNLDGQNYPHFRNATDKNSYCAQFISKTAYGSVPLTIISFDTASVVLNSHPAGVKTDDAAGVRYGWVVGWSAGSRPDAFKLELKLDYWLTYWPLTFNTAAVRVVRRHAPRFLLNDGAKFKLGFTTHTGHAGYFTPELTDFAVDVPQNSCVSVNFLAGLTQKKALVLSSGGKENDADDLIKINLNANGELTNQEGCVLLQTTDDADPINQFANSSFLSNAFSFGINPNKMQVLDWSKYYNGPTSGNSSFAFTSEPPNPDFATLLNTTPVMLGEGKKGDKSNVSYGMSTLGLLIGLSLKFNQNGPAPNYNTDYIFVNTKDDQSKSLVYYPQLFESDNTTKPKLDSVLPIKLIFGDSYADEKGTNYIWRYTASKNKTASGVGATTLNILNQYLKSNPISCPIKIDLNSYYALGKTAHQQIGNPMLELKLGTAHTKYWLNYATARHDFNPTLMGVPQGSGTKGLTGGEVTVDYLWYQFATVNNFYQYFVPQAANFKSEAAKIYNFLAPNLSKLPTYSDTAIKFAQTQGQSYSTGLALAEGNRAWTKRYSDFAMDQASFNAVMTSLGGIFGGIAAGMSGGGGGMGGLVKGAFGGVFGAAAGVGRGVFGVAGTELANQQRNKNAEYGVRNLKAGKSDATRNPLQTSINDAVELNYRMLTTDLKPAVQYYQPSKTDIRKIAAFYHQMGHACDTYEQVDFNRFDTRHFFNFWQISNLEQAILKDKYPMMVVNGFNTQFNRGVRLGNSYFSDVKFNDYGLENWEQNYYELTYQPGPSPVPPFPILKRKDYQINLVNNDWQIGNGGVDPFVFDKDFNSLQFTDTSTTYNFKLTDETRSPLFFAIKTGRGEMVVPDNVKVRGDLCQGTIYLPIPAVAGRAMCEGEMGSNTPGSYTSKDTFNNYLTTNRIYGTPDYQTGNDFSTTTFYGDQMYNSKIQFKAKKGTIAGDIVTAMFESRNSADTLLLTRIGGLTDELDNGNYSDGTIGFTIKPTLRVKFKGVAATNKLKLLSCQLLNDDQPITKFNLQIKGEGLYPSKPQVFRKIYGGSHIDLIRDYNPPRVVSENQIEMYFTIAYEVDYPTY